MKTRKKKGSRGKRVEIFCYECKRYIEVTGTKELTPEQVFKNQGHYGDQNTDKMPFLKPNLGRSSRRHERAVAKKKTEEVMNA